MGLRPDVLGVLAEVGSEVERAMKQHGPMASPHEGYAVILEELDELKDEIWTNKGRTEAAWKEATQVAAMAVRYLLDLRDAAATPKTYEVVKSLRPHECRFGCDSDYAVNCNCGGDCPKHKAFAAVSGVAKREKEESADGAR